MEADNRTQKMNTPQFHLLLSAAMAQDHFALFLIESNPIIHNQKKKFKKPVDKTFKIIYTHYRCSEQSKQHSDKRVWFNGRTSAFQAEYVGSIPITRSYAIVA